MTKTIAVHSYRGGTGKTLVAVNLAGIFVSKGRNVCLMDLDFRAPSLYSVFNLGRQPFYLNDFFDGACGFKDVLVDVTQRYAVKGRFLVAPADPDMEAIQKYTLKDRRWEMGVLRRLLSLKSSFFEDAGVDYVLLDTSPGIQYSSINAIVGSDLTIIVTSLDKSDLEGTRKMLSQFIDVFEKKALILANKVVGGNPCQLQSLDRNKLVDELTTSLGVRVLEAVPCYCDVMGSGGRMIFALEKPEHPFAVVLTSVSEVLERF